VTFGAIGSNFGLQEAPHFRLLRLPIQVLIALRCLCHGGREVSFLLITTYSKNVNMRSVLLTISLMTALALSKPLDKRSYVTETDMFTINVTETADVEATGLGYLGWYLGCLLAVIAFSGSHNYSHSCLDSGDLHSSCCQLVLCFRY
jgi:hypothetical protein